MTNRVVNKEFEVVSLNKEGIKKAQFVSEEFDSLLSQILTVVPEGRYLSLVRTKLEEASFFAKKGIAQDSTNQTK